MCDGVRTLRHILVDEIEIFNHGIISPEEHRPPCVKRGEQTIIVAAHLIRYIHTTHSVIVVINAERNYHLFLLQTTKDSSGLLCIGALPPRLLS